MEGQYHSNTMRLINKYSYKMFMYILTTEELVILFIDQWFDEVGVVV